MAAQMKINIEKNPREQTQGFFADYGKGKDDTVESAHCCAPIMDTDSNAPISLTPTSTGAGMQGAWLSCLTFVFVALTFILNIIYAAVEIGSGVNDELLSKEDIADRSLVDSTGATLVCSTASDECYKNFVAQDRFHTMFMLQIILPCIAALVLAVYYGCVAYPMVAGKGLSAFVYAIYLAHMLLLTGISLLEFGLAAFGKGLSKHMYGFGDEDSENEKRANASRHEGLDGLATLLFFFNAIVLCIAIAYPLVGIAMRIEKTLSF